MLLEESSCLTAVAHPCSSKNLVVSRADAQAVTGLVSSAAKSTNVGCEFCAHGANIVPWLVNRYKIRSLVEVGVCTGMSVVHVVRKAVEAVPNVQAPSVQAPNVEAPNLQVPNVQVGSAKDRIQAAVDFVHAGRALGSGGRRRDLSGAAPGLDKYYLVDAWGGNKCHPGCGCSRQINQMAKSWPDVITPLRGYSVPMSASIPNGTLDLAFIDAAHDFRNARADIIAYWPKLKADGIMAGHDFAHWRNWAEVRQDKLASRGPYSVRHAMSNKASRGGLPPAYGVAQATQELFVGCHVHVRWNTWWVERASCEIRELLRPSDLV